MKEQNSQLLYQYKHNGILIPIAIWPIGLKMEKKQGEESIFINQLNNHS
jgi:hypothetical protein